MFGACHGLPSSVLWSMLGAPMTQVDGKRTGSFAAIGLVCWALFAPPVHAQDVVAAASAFERAQRAEVAGDAARAAELYELADRISPTPEALRNATRSRLSARQWVSAASDAEELLRRYSGDADSRTLAEEVLRRTRPQLVRMTVHCADPCTLVLDGLATGTSAQVDHVAYAEPGSHTLTAHYEDGADETLPVQGQPGDERDLGVPHNAPPPAPAPVVAPVAQPAPIAVQADTGARTDHTAPEHHGISPIYFYVAAGSTLVLGGVTLWSGIDLLNARDHFKADKTPTQKAFDAGEHKDTRTSVLIGCTAAFAVGTAALAFFSDFHGHRAASGVQSGRFRGYPAPTVAFDNHGARLAVQGAF
jgi:hypothetical protein